MSTLFPPVCFGQPHVPYCCACYAVMHSCVYVCVYVFLRLCGFVVLCVCVYVVTPRQSVLMWRCVHSCVFVCVCAIRLFECCVLMCSCSLCYAVMFLVFMYLAFYAFMWLIVFVFYLHMGVDQLSWPPNDHGHLFPLVSNRFSGFQPMVIRSGPLGQPCVFCVYLGLFARG